MSVRLRHRLFAEITEVLRFARAGEAPARARRWLAFRLLQGTADTLAFTRAGVRWTAFVDDLYVSFPLFVGGGYQNHELRGLVRWLRRRGLLRDKTTIVDVGANIGTTSIPLAQETGLRILAIEPIWENVEMLRRNAAANGLANRITCVHAAISDIDGRVRLQRGVHNSGSSEVWEGASDAAGLVEAPALRLDEALRGHDIAPRDVALVWSDTQGCERYVIETGTSLWTAGAPLYVEVWPRALRSHGGVDRFVAAVEGHFGTLVTWDDLRYLGDRAPCRPVSHLRRVVASLRNTKSTDALLLPAPAPRQVECGNRHGAPKAPR